MLSQILCYRKENYFSPQLPVCVTIGIGKNNAPDVPSHTHDFMELVIMVRGSMVHDITFCDKSSVSYEVLSGDVFSIQPDEIHNYHDAQDSFYYNILFDPDLLLPLREMRENNPVFRTLFCQKDSRSKLYIPIQYRASLIQSCMKIISEISKRDICYEVYILAAFHELIINLCRHVTTVKPLYADHQNSKILQIISEMKEHPEKSFSNPEVARKACVSVSLLYSLFHRATGMPPQAYLLNLRLKNAQHLLLNTNDTIEKIAVQCGFCDSNYFIKQFRRKNRVTPLEYRRQFQSSSYPKNSK